MVEALELPGTPGAERPCELLHLARKARVEASFDEAEEHLDEAVALLARLRMLPGAVESGADIVDLEDENTRRARVELLHARALHELGEVRLEMGELDGAQDALVDAIDLFGRLRLRYDDGARSLGKYCQPNELYLADRRARSCLEFVRMRLEFRNATAMLCGCGGSHDADPATV